MKRNLGLYTLKSFSFETASPDSFETKTKTFAAFPVEFEIGTFSDFETKETREKVTGGIGVWRTAADFAAGEPALRIKDAKLKFEIDNSLPVIAQIKIQILSLLGVPATKYAFDYFKFHAMNGYVRLRAVSKTTPDQFVERQFADIEKFEQFLTSNPDIAGIQTLVWQKAKEIEPKLSKFI